MSKLNKGDAVWVSGEDVAQIVTDIIIQYEERILEIRKAHLKELKGYSDRLPAISETMSKGLLKLAERDVQLMDKIDELYKYKVKKIEGNKAKSGKRKALLIKEYDYYISMGLDDKDARIKANDELRDDDKLHLKTKKGERKGFERTHLNNIIDEHIGKK